TLDRYSLTLRNRHCTNHGKGLSMSNADNAESTAASANLSCATDSHVHPSARVASSVHLGAGVDIGAGARLAEGCRIVNGTANQDKTIDHKLVSVGSQCHIGPEATLMDVVDIGNKTEIGSRTTVHDNAVLGDRVRVGYGCTIADGAVIADGA